VGFVATKDIRKLAHEMLDELEDEELSKVIHTMRSLKDNKGKVMDNFPMEKPTPEEIAAIKKAKEEFENGEIYSHQDVFGEEDYV
jgi:hypothetical protein